MKNIINKLIAFALSKSPENPKKQTDKSLVEFFGIIAALSIIFLIWFNYPSFINWMDTPSYKVQIPLLPSAMVPTPLNPNDFNNIGERFGTYGDAYGSLNTLFSGFAFAILIISLFMQRQELKEQRKELAAQREEISKSNDIAEQQKLITDQQAKLIQQQVRDAQRQNLNEIFFRYLDEKDNKEKNLKIESSNPTNGGECFVKYRASLETYLLNHHFQFDVIQDEISRHSLLNNHLTAQFNQRESISKHVFNRSGYFNFYIFIINFLEKNADIIDVNEYVEILLTYANQDELVCLIWYGLSHIELNKTIKKYSIHRKINYVSYPKIYQYLFPLYD